MQLSLLPLPMNLRSLSVLLAFLLLNTFVVYVAITTCPSTDPETSVVLIGDFVAQSLAVYVAKTTLPFH